MAITDWPEDERPRERLLAQGAASLSDAELLAIFLRVGSKGRSAVDLARELIGGFGGLTRLFAASQARFFGDARHGARQVRTVAGGPGDGAAGARRGAQGAGRHLRFAGRRSRLPAAASRRPAARGLSWPCGWTRRIA
jgi:hypothetical protein